MKHFVPASLVGIRRSMRSGTSWSDATTLVRVQRRPRYVKGDAPLLGGSVRYIDSASLVSAYGAIFGRRIYDFGSDTEAPVIIDGGANIGLASLFWTREIEAPRVVAFEPDPDAADALRTNLDRFGVTGVVVHEKAISNAEGEMSFQRDMADGGRLATPNLNGATLVISSVRLADLLGESVNLLKLDIEGAEVSALIDGADEISNAERIFVEYHGRVDETQRLHEMLAVLTDAGFRYWIQGEWAPENPFVSVDVDSGMDLRLNVFAARHDVL